MLDEAGEIFSAFLSESSDSSPGITALRAMVVYIAALVIVRLGSKRFLSKATAFDVLVAIMLGSILSRGIDGRTSLLSTLAGACVLVAAHWLIGVLAVYADWLGPVVKGHRVLLIRNGKVQREEMRHSHITRKDLEQAVRIQTRQSDLRKVEAAYLERNGEISIVPYEKEPEVAEVAVNDGVQTVRIELHR